MKALKKNDTYELTLVPKDKEQWEEARYIAKGYSQGKNADFKETFSHTALLTSKKDVDANCNSK